MSVTLFRSEVATRRSGAPSPALLSDDVPATLFVVGAAASLLLFAAVAVFPRTERAEGFVKTAGAARVAPPYVGTVIDLLAAEGQAVNAGQPLVKVAPVARLGDGRQLADALTASLAVRAQALRLHVREARERGVAERRRLEEQIATRRAQLVAIEEQRVLQRQRIANSEQQLAAIAPVRERGFISDRDYRERERNWIADRQALAALDEQRAALTGEIAEVRQALERLPAETADRVASLEAELAVVEGQGAEAELRGPLTLRSPIAGRVSSVQAYAGSPADPARPLMLVVPTGGEARVVLRASGRAAAKAVPGQRVRLRYETLAGGAHAAAYGRVEHIARAATYPSELLGPVRADGPSFQIVVRPEKALVEADGRLVAPPADTAVSAALVVERRTLLGWLVEPIRRAWAGAKG